MPPGTSENPATLSSAPATAGAESGASEPAVSSGTASAAMIKAAEAASSAAPEPAVPAGTPSPTAGSGTPGATSGAIGQPKGAVSASGQPAGEAPESRIERAVHNAREAVRQEVESKFSAFRGMDPADAQAGLQLLHAIRSNPQEFLQELGGRINQGREADEPYPEADLVSADGKLKTYRAETLHKAFDVHGNRVIAQVMQKIQPYLDFINTEQGRRQVAEQEGQQVQMISTALADARKLRHFTKANEGAILESLRAIPQEQRDALGPVAALHMAYNNFVESHVFPTIDSDAEARVRANFQKKVHATTGTVSPSSSDQTGEPKRPVLRNSDQLARHMEWLAQQAESAL